MFVEQIHLNHTLLQQLLNLRLGDRRDVVEFMILLGLKLFELRSFDHPSVADQRDSRSAEALSHLANFQTEGFGVDGVAIKRGNGNGHTYRVAQHSICDLHFSAIAVLVIAEKAANSLQTPSK